VAGKVISDWAYYDFKLSLYDSKDQFKYKIHGNYLYFLKILLFFMLSNDKENFYNGERLVMNFVVKLVPKFISTFKMSRA
jgi:hypothetical protein